MRRFLAIAAIVALTTACADSTTAPERTPNIGAWLNPTPTPDALGSSDTLLFEFDWGGHMNVRRGSTYIARGVKTDWKIGDPIPRKANGQEYYEWYSEPPIGSVPPPKNTGPVNQERNCLSEINGIFAKKKARRNVQSLVWEIDNRQPRRELVTGDVTSFFRTSSSGQAGGNWRMCVKLDSIKVSRTAWEYTHLTGGGVYFWWDTYGAGNGNNNGFDQAAGWAWCYGHTGVGEPCQNPPAVVTRVAMSWSRYCNYFEPNQTSQQFYAGNLGGAGNITLEKPSWSIQAYAGFDYQAHTATLSWGGDDFGHNAPYGISLFFNPPSITVCAFSSNNYDQREGQATWRLDQNYEF